MRNMYAVVVLFSFMTISLWAGGHQDFPLEHQESGSDINFEGAPVMSIDWTTALEDLDLEDGKSFSFVLPPGGSSETVVGTGVYADASSIGSAAVQAGLISFEKGGTVSLQTMGSQDYYRGSDMNGVYSITAFYAFQSFQFLDGQGDVLIIPIPFSWSTGLTSIPVGVEILLDFAPSGTKSFAFGSGPYDADSSVGTAAVHAGEISFEDGGVVKVKIVEPQDSKGQTQNSVTSRDVSGGKSSFVFVNQN